MASSLSVLSANRCRPGKPVEHGLVNDDIGILSVLGEPGGGEGVAAEDDLVAVPHQREAHRTIAGVPSYPRGWKIPTRGAGFLAPENLRQLAPSTRKRATRESRAA